MRKTVKLPQISNVAAGAEASLVIPLRPTYERITLEYTGVTLAQLENIELRINGNPVQTYKDGAQLDALNKFYSRPETAGFLTLWFARPELTNLSQRRMTALATADVRIQTASLHIDVDGAAAAPVLKAHAVTSAPRDSVAMTVIRQFPHDSSVTGQVEIDSIPRGPRIIGIHLGKADISDVELEIDQVKIYDASKALGEANQKQNGRVPQTAAYTHIDMMGDNDVGNALVTANATDLRIRPTLDTSGATQLMVEYLQDLSKVA